MTVSDFTGDGVVDSISAYFLGNAPGVFYHFDVSTRGLGQNLAPGTYSDARRYPSEGSGYAGLDFDLNGRGSNTLTGNYTVNAIDVDYSGATPRLVSLSVSFEQHSEGLTAASYGTFNYNHNATAELQPEFVVELPNEGTDTVESSMAYVLPSNVENLVLTGAADIDGTGNPADNVLTGNAGTNVLRGGAGNDSYVVQDAGDIVIENANEGNDTLVVPFTYALTVANVENLTLSGSGNVDGTGTGGDNVLTGNAGVNTLRGGAGNDTYVIQNTGDVVIENADEGLDTVAIEAGYIDGNGNLVFSYTLPGNTENVVYRGHTAFTLTGNALDNVLTGGDRSDRLVGLGGNDTMDGGPGYDTTVFSGTQSSYTFLHRGAALIVVNANAGTSSTVTNVERVSFSDSFLLPKTAPTQLDFGSDGRSELLMRNATTGLVQLWTMDGTRPGAASDVAVAGGEWTIVGNGDFNGDGRGDVLWRDGNGLLATWEMDQSTLLAGSTVQTVTNDWKITGTGNFNPDVYNDILWRNDNGQVGLWEMKGSSFLAASVIVTGTPHDEIPTNWQIQGVGDFNGDGKTDILWRDYDTGDMGVWEMYGSTIAGATVVDAPPPTSWTVVGMGDFNADNRTDVLWRNGNELDAWLMDGGHSTRRGALETVGANQTVVGVGDVSGDGRADILLQDTAGTLSAHLVDGLTVTARANVGTIGSDWVLS